LLLKHRIGWLLITLCLMSAIFTPPCYSAEQPGEPGDEARTDLDVALKLGTLLSRAPDDPFLFDERDSALGFLRLRLGLTHRFTDTLTSRVAYEHQIRARSHGSQTGLGSDLLPAFSDAPYRIVPLENEIVDETSTFVWRHELDRALLAAHPDWGEITVGRQAIGLGRGVIFGSVDVFAPFSALEVDREWRRGVDAARIEYRLSPTSSFELLGVGGDTWNDAALLARYRGYVGRLDGELIAGKRGRDAMYGAVASAFIGGAEAHGEIAVFDTPEAQPGGGLFGNDHMAAQATLGASYTFGLGNGLTLLGEYQYNGFGVREAEDILPKLREQNFQNRFLRGDMRILGRHGFALQTSYPFSNVWSGSLLLVGSPEDGSGVASPSLAWDVSDHVTIDAAAFLPWGAEPEQGILQSEYGGRPTSLFLQMSMYY
jgi:hypothetical protein